MANASGQGTVWNLPNYAGELFTADMINTPFLSMIGGLTGGKQTENFEFPVDSTYTMPAAAQPGITETASLTAPTAIGYTRDQKTNVTQIFQEKVSISYVKLSNAGRMSGLNTAGQQNNAPSEKDFQIARSLEKIGRDIEYTCLNGVYQVSTSATVANKTRGMISLCSTGSTVAAAGASLSKSLMDTLFRTMYSFAPQDRNVGGVNIKQIETDFGNIGIALCRFMPIDTILASEMSAISPVFQPVPEKGNFFYETLAKAGASEDGQIFGQFGLAHGDIALHGTITGLATS
ncbi:MAG: hypothetical protein K0S61_4923 [Anaerocolumna sp.]|nr:hypothetical protein [Anaerocolumna sp.]